MQTNFMRFIVLNILHSGEHILRSSRVASTDDTVLWIPRVTHLAQ